MQNKKSAEVVVARRLRPIYDSLDAGQFKKAIVEADKVLKKHPQTHTAKALKALSFIRIGDDLQGFLNFPILERSAEALPLLKTVENELAKEEEFDENTVQALCHCYKVCFVLKKIKIGIKQNFNIFVEKAKTLISWRKKTLTFP